MMPGGLESISVLPKRLNWGVSEWGSVLCVCTLRYNIVLELRNTLRGLGTEKEYVCGLSGPLGYIG